MKLNETHLKVQEKYAAAAKSVGSEGCCGSSCGCGCDDPVTSGLYSGEEKEGLPEDAIKASLGCGNPTALATLTPGETVLDLGSGGGIDVLLSAKRVGPTGFVYGLDMTDEMLELAEKNRREAGVQNVKFLKGNIEEIPLPDSSVDVVISNCVINLASDKGAVLREAFRVLRPGGRFAVSDVVVEGELPLAVQRDMEAYVGCISGALEINDYIRLLNEAGFTNASIEPTRRYFLQPPLPSGGEGAGGEGLGTPDSSTLGSAFPSLATLTPEERKQVDGKVMGAFVRATKP